MSNDLTKHFLVHSCIVTMDNQIIKVEMEAKANVISVIQLHINYQLSVISVIQVMLLTLSLKDLLADLQAQ